MADRDSSFLTNQKAGIAIDLGKRSLVRGSEKIDFTSVIRSSTGLPTDDVMVLARFSGGVIPANIHAYLRTTSAESFRAFIREVGSSTSDPTTSGLSTQRGNSVASLADNPTNVTAVLLPAPDLDRDKVYELCVSASSAIPQDANGFAEFFIDWLSY